MVPAGDGDDARGVEALGLDRGALGAVRVGDGGVPGQEVEVVARGGVQHGASHHCIWRRRWRGLLLMVMMEVMVVVVVGVVGVWVLVLHHGRFKCEVIPSGSKCSIRRDFHY